jgi:hypothetical protein
VVTTDGQQPAVLTIYVDRERARVISHVGAASVVSTGEGDRQAGGKEMSQSPRGGGWKRAGLVAGAIGAASAAKIGGQGATAATNALTFSRLFKAGINYSINPMLDNGPGFEDPFETSITCRDSDKKYCHKKSGYKPKRP